MRKEIQAALRGGAGDDGLVQRFQLLVEPDLHGSPVSLDRWPNTEARVTAFEVYRRLAGNDAGRLGAEVEAGNGAFLRFSRNAQPLFSEWYTALERKLSSSTESPPLIAHLSKYRSLMPTLGLLVHLADVVTGLAPTGPVTLAAAEMAISWCELLEAHARRVYGAAIERRSPAHLLSEKILVGEVASPFTVREVTRHHWSGLNGTDGVERAVQELEAAHWLRRVEEGSGGQKKILFHINPKVFEQ